MKLEKEKHSRRIPIGIGIGIGGGHHRGPWIGIGIWKSKFYPINEACQIAYSTICTWLNENADYPMQITLSCFNQEVYDAYINVAKT